MIYSSLMLKHMLLILSILKMWLHSHFKTNSFQYKKWTNKHPCRCISIPGSRESVDYLLVKGTAHTGMKGTGGKITLIRESVDSLCRDGADTPIVRVHWKAFLTREYSRFKPFSAREWPIRPLLYPTIPHK